MAQGSSPEAELIPPRPRRWLRALAIAAGGLSLAGLGLGWWGYSVARRELPPFLQRNLSDALGRPIKVGEFERFSPTGVRLGPSIVPPTEADFSWVRAQSLEVNFNPLDLLLTRTLRPSLIFIDPQVALKQGFNGEWRVQIPQSVGEEGFFKTELSSIQIRNANLAIGPLSRTSIVELPEGVSSANLVLLENVNLRVRFGGPNNQTASLIVGGRLNNGAFQLRGEGQIDTRQFNLAVQAQQLPIEAVNPLFGGSFFVRNGLLSSNLDLRYRPETADRLTVRGTARLRNGDIVIGDLPAALQDINGTMQLNGGGGRLENSSLKFGPILVRAAGQVDVHKGHDLEIDIPEVSLDQVAEALAQSLPVQAAGRFQVKASVTGPLRTPQVDGTLANLGLVQIDRLGLDAIAARFGANLDGATLHQATLTPVTGGTVTAQGQVLLNGALSNGAVTHDALANRDRPTQPQPPHAQPYLTLTAQTDLPLDRLAALYGVSLPETWRLGPLLTEARLFGPLARLQGEADWQMPQSTFPSRGQLTYADRLVTAKNAVFEVGAGRLEAIATADLTRRDWQAQVAGNALDLDLVSPQLRGTLDTDLDISGSLNALNLQGIQALGQARFSHAVPLNLAIAAVPHLNLAGLDQMLPGALSTRFAWTGQRLDIAEATTANLSARGGIEMRFLPQGGLPQIGTIDLAARLSEINLESASGLVKGPAWLRPRGTLAFDGTLRGTLADPHLVGTIGLRQVGLNQFTLVDAVSGPVQASRTAGATLSLRGRDEEISANLAADLRPNAFRLASKDVLAQGQRQGDRLQTELHNFDLAALGLHPLTQPDLGQLGGKLNATATLNLADLANPEAIAQFALDRPALGSLGCDRFTGHLQYRDGLAQLTGGSLQLISDTKFQVTGSGRLFPHWQGEAQITTAEADFQDLLATLNLYSYADISRVLSPLGLGTAADLTVTSVGDTTASLEALAELAQALRSVETARHLERAHTLLPALSQLKGSVAGRLGVKASRIQGLTADFEFTGQDWAWGRYAFDNRFLARGQLQNQVLSLDPVEFRTGEARLRLVGDLSPQQSDLAVGAEGLPLRAAATLLESPVAVTGLLNLNAHLTGPYTNPHLRGDMAVAEASLNHQPLTEISSRFQYQNAALSVDGRVVGSHPEPLSFSGTIPYALPFMTAQPASGPMMLRATLKDEALALVNLFTPALVWGGGQATVDLRLSGTPRRPLLSGDVSFADASLISPWLGTSLDHLTGNIQLQGTQIRIDSLTGSLFDGTVALAGQVPLITQDARPTDPGLRLSLANLDVNYANEVRSRVTGELTLTQALLAPTIGGQVQLQNTRVSVGRGLLQQANQILAKPDLDRVGNTPGRIPLRQISTAFPLQFDNLRLVLDPAQMRVLPLLSLNLEGAVALNGLVPDLSADGALYLTHGWINTITTEFFLAPGRSNVVLFKPENALDPYLDLVLEASVPLQRQYNINALNSTTGAAEIPTLDRLASTTVLDELLIEARVQGQASRLLDNLNILALTSTPTYGQNQLLGMVTGGYLASLGGTEPGLALGSNLLGAFTADSQDAIAHALGLRRLRLVGTTVLPTTNKDSLGLGVGAAIGITENLSASLVQVLNQSQPFALNARYRIDDTWSISGSTDVSNAGRAFVEYRRNFR
ncbi:translocation/assembly module TamB domain-containing protein [Nodosilinea sp. E11]|uniref:translocation/assembly module TamB domain-containing protein n=1 Tax=Nodosilinea sp. E11 TaxID=3037479 RepID=UPI00293455F2|nr:translocation/assembly module TamB domain-containing protein [Nodosilinea sp. E11]WOD41332.1 translocation/assembly module TamB domain-containing protein [Nodosilinea sp. E11]